MDTDKRQKLMVLMQRHGIVELDYSDDTETISLSFASDDRPAIRSNGIGVFLNHHPMSKNCQQINGRIKKGDLLGFLKNGPLLRPITAEQDCHIRVAKVVDGTLVGYGDCLYETA